MALYGGMRSRAAAEGGGGARRGVGRVAGGKGEERGEVGTKQRSLAHILLCILLFWLANIQDGRPPVILGWRRGVRVLARARAAARARASERARMCVRACTE